MIAFADRRRALVGRRTIGNLFGAEREVVRASLDGDRNTLRACRGNGGQGVGRSEVHDVDAGTGVTRETHEHIDGRVLGRGWTAGQPCRIASGVLAGIGLAQQPRPFGMCQQWQTEPRQHRHGRTQVRLTDVRELVDTRRAEKTLEAEHAGPGQWLEIGGVARHHAAPEANIHMAPSASGAPLRVQPVDGRGRRNAVQRHVHQRRHAAGRRRARGGLETFPIGAAWIVDVDVRVDQARQHDVGARIDLARAGPAIRMRADRHDPALAHVDGRRPHPVGQDDPFAPDDPGIHGDQRERVALIKPWGSSVATKISLRFSRPKRDKSTGK